ncbi:MAG: hypothetical protein JJU11_17930 [Candidatus Sumerlaeia bacterium]|nr:hypothetical protein [Candidatus Sumerlaeia bacterium]
MIVTLVMLGAVLATLLWLRDRLIEGEENLVQGTVLRFESTEVLGRPEAPGIVFADVETLAEASTGSFIREIYVTKSVLGRGEITIHPFHADLADPDWRENRPWLRLPVGEGPDGYLYLDLNMATLRAVNGAIGLVLVLLVGGFGFLILRQRQKEARLDEVIQELESNRAQVIQLERLALAGQLSANVFHDIKKPVLNIKHESSDHLEGDGRQPSEVLRAAREQTTLFLEMLRDLGMESFVNARTDEQEWCSLPDLVERSLRLVRYEQEDIEIQTVYTPPDGAFLIKAPPHRMVQVFSNLILNAFQAMGGTGQLYIHVESVGKGSIVRMEDSGPGIDPSRRDDLFSPFVTTRAGEGGSGLGLYISRSIITEIGGTIRIDTPQKLGGACFLMELPNPEPDGETSKSGE